ncbi:hypothetical protein LJY25_00315 [Hymenobacter sp. BT175]|uniref:beta strand repeat-containing protein n=1 Tax=Hymenobacter translucens TaxID=2886507 RepID=UPI001D0F2C6F|nr:hypothetical protein [Hymenobacter translucens]MCC2544872.1 hypothetical protein [Hymenobacter translucens]
MLYLYPFTHFTRLLSLTGCFLLLALLLPGVSWAQAPAWAHAASSTQGTGSGTSISLATAVDGSGNVFVTGYFSGQVSFGNTLLTSAGNHDLFVAKYVPGTNTWVWAQSGGGTVNDEGWGVAVSGNSVYVTGSIQNNTNDIARVRFGGTGPATSSVQVNGARTDGAVSEDLVLLKYTDNGSSALLGWTQVGGGSETDMGYSVAASGSSVYVTGYYQNNLADSKAVRFGGSGTTPGTVQVNGASTAAGYDLLVAKYTDNGSSATVVWTQVGGGTHSDRGTDITVSGTSVYVTGTIVNNTTDAETVRFGGSGTTPGTVQLNGVSTVRTILEDIVVLKYTDSGNSATLAWTQVGGGTGNDFSTDIAVSGSSLYVTGTIANTSADAKAVRFGASGTTPGTVQQNGTSTTNSFDLLVAKYTDNGSSATVVWTQVGGGSGDDIGQGIVVNGTSVYVTGSITNTTADVKAVRFGGSGTTPGTVQQNGASATISSDLVVVKYTDNGGSATLGWTQVGGGTGQDLGSGIAVSGQSVLIGGFVVPSASFGSFTIPSPIGANTTVLVRLLDTSLPLAVSGKGNRALTLFPNPAYNKTTLTGAVPGAEVCVLDALGRTVARTTADARGTAMLVLRPGLTGGVYVVRAGTRVLRLAVE